MSHFRLATFAIVTLCMLARPHTSALAQAGGSETRTWSGTLFDTARNECGPEVQRSASPGTCPVSICTMNFGIRTADGKFLKFDEGSNPKAVNALRKSRQGSKIVFAYWQTGKMSKPITARVTGTLTGDTLNVDSIRID